MFILPLTNPKVIEMTTALVHRAGMSPSTQGDGYRLPVTPMRGLDGRTASSMSDMIHIVATTMEVQIASMSW